MLSPMSVPMEALDDVPWVLVGVYGSGYVAQCQVCGASASGAEEQIHAFADAHAAHQSSSQTHMGAGDLVAGLAKALGFSGCTPCEQRRRALNQAMPHVPLMRRR